MGPVDHPGDAVTCSKLNRGGGHHGMHHRRTLARFEVHLSAMRWLYAGLVAAVGPWAPFLTLPILVLASVASWRARGGRPVVHALVGMIFGAAVAFVIGLPS